MSETLPADVDAEEGIIANLLMANSHEELANTFDLCSEDGIGLKLISDPTLSRVWGALQQTSKDSGTVDLPSIARHAAIQIGDLIRIQGAQPTSINFRALRVRVRKAYVAREIALLGLNAAESYLRPDFDPSHLLENMAHVQELATNKSLVKELKDSLLSGDELADLRIAPRRHLLGTWLREGSLGFLHGPRGIGKTWYSLGMARAIAEGTTFGPWKAAESQHVTYIDGEMPLESVQQRDAVLRTAGGPLYFLNHERYFEKTGKSLNLTNRETQEAISRMLRDAGSRVLFLDNLSCLFSAVKENDADEWEKILPWLLNLRRRKVAVIIVHHSGRSGNHMRGTSRREDAAFWVVQLCEPSSGMDGDGAKFISQFSKNRDGIAEETQAFEWTFEPKPNGKVNVHYRKISPLDELVQWLRDGVTSCGDISEAMGISKPRVSKLAAKAMKQGLLTKRGRDYELLEPQ